jgi:hypothetical protein
LTNKIPAFTHTDPVTAATSGNFPKPVDIRGDLGGICVSRLVIVSNRIVDLDNQSGALAVALGEALRSIGGIWFGWDGNIVEQGTPIEVSRTVQNNSPLPQSR